MSYNPKVVSFERNAAYVHHCAMKNRRANNPVDALELMRQAVEQSPQNREYRLDLAEMYCDMGCHELSNRILLDMLREDDPPAECYYGLALNQLGRNENASARRALRMYSSRAADDAYMEEAGSLIAEMDYYDSLKRPLNRRRGRAARIAERACQALKTDDVEGALRRFRRSLDMNPNQPEMRALYAMALYMSGAREDALSQAAMSLEDMEASVRTLCVTAQIYYMCGDVQQAQRLIDRAQNQRPEGVELRLLIYALSEMKMYPLAADALKLALREEPHDKALLHMRAVALHRCGAEDGQLVSFWARILRIDPEDSVARYYHDAAQQGRLGECEPEFVYEVPAAEFRMRLFRIAQELSMGLESAVEQWRTDAEFRGLIQWAVGAGDENCGRAAMMVLASADDARAESCMRELMYRGSVPLEVKLHGLYFMRMRGGELERVLPPDTDMQDGILPEAEDMLSEMPACERQLVRFADEVLSQEYQLCAGSALVMIWRAYRDACHGANDPLVCTQEAAAALAWCYLLGHGKKVSPGRLAREFACSLRRLTYYASHMAAVLESCGAFACGDVEDE